MTPERYEHHPIIVFRVVLANPLTTMEILEGILQEQREIASMEPVQSEVLKLRACGSVP